jgi:hypothetical protein
MSSILIHPCDTPGLSAIRFLYAVMLHPNASPMTRIEAADRLLRTGHGNRAFVQAIKNRIGVYRKPRPRSPAPGPTLRLATVNGVRVHL